MMDVGSLRKVLVDTMLVAALVLVGCCCADAAVEDARVTMDATGLSDVTIISMLSVASCVCLVVAVVGCASCCKTGFAKFEETTTETSVVGQNYTSFSDFSPPTMSTPSCPPGAPEPEPVTIEPLPHLPGRTSNQWVNVLRVGGVGGLDPGQTMQSIKLIDSPRFQFPRSQISYVDEMGNGWFGKVLQGEAQRMHPGLRKTRVVIKQLRDMATPEEQLLFLQEVQPYREVNHPNVLLLLGQCIDSMPLLLILEYAPFGDLKSYLRKHRSETQAMAQQDIQLKMAADMVSGLMWLHQADFLYFDLATRNCQVSADTSVKIGDYGLALEKYPDDYYITKDNSQAIPIRWLGPEIIDLSEDGTVKTKKITKESNVWSFGIMMLELSTGAKRPYAKLTDEEVLQQVVKEQEIRVDKPNLDIHYANKWFEIMMYCWLEADIRPTMKELHDLISYLKSNRDRIEMPDFEARWNNLKPAALQESSESGKEEEVPPAAMPKNPASGFQNDFTKPQATETRQADAPITESIPPKSDSTTGGFDSDFGVVPVASAVRAASLTPNVPSLNRNMNAETGVVGKQPLFDDDFVTAEVQPNVETLPDLGAPTADRFQSSFVMRVDAQPTQSSPVFSGMEGGIELREAIPQRDLSGPEPDLTPSSASVLQTEPAAAIMLTTDSSDKPQPSRDEDVIASASVTVPDMQRTSTPLAGEALASSADVSALSPAVDEGPHSFISTASMALNRTTSPDEVSMEFHSVISPDSDSQPQFLSFNTVDTTPSTNYQTPDGDQTRSSMDDDSFGTVQSEEPTFVILSDTGPDEAPSSSLFTQSHSPDHSPTQFTSFVSAETSEGVEPAGAAIPFSEGTPVGFQMVSTADTDGYGSLVVEPPGEETMGQSGLLDFTDSSVTTPQQLSSDFSILPSYTALQAVNSPLTITMSAQGADQQQQEGALIVQSESGDASVSRTFTSSSSSSSSSSTRVVRTVRTVRQVQMVGGEEVATVSEVTTPEGDGVVSMVTGSDGEGTIISTFSGGESQISSSQSSYQSSRQVLSSSSVMTEADSNGQLASFTVTPTGEMMASSSTMSSVKQMSSKTSSSSSMSVTRQISGQKISSFEGDGATTKVVRQVSGGSSSSMTREFSSSSSSSSLTAASSSEVVTAQQGGVATLQQLTDGTLANQTAGGGMTVAMTGDDNAALLEQFGSEQSMSTFSQSSSSQSLTRSEASSQVISSSEQGGEGQKHVTMSSSKSSSQTQQQMSSVQLTTKNVGDATFNFGTLSLGTPNGGSLAEGEPGTTVDRTMTVMTGPGQMSVGQAVTMQGGGSAVKELENGAQVSVQWQGTSAAQQEHSIFTSEVSSGEPGNLMERLAGQSNQVAIPSPEGESVD